MEVMVKQFGVFSLILSHCSYFLTLVLLKILCVELAHNTLKCLQEVLGKYNHWKPLAALMLCAEVSAVPNQKSAFQAEVMSHYW